MSVRCSWPQGCARVTRDPSGRCQDHRRNALTRTTDASRVVGTPSPADPSISVTRVSQRYRELPEGQEYDVAPAHGAACIEYRDGERRWVVNRQLHREDGPAIHRPNESQLWYINGQLHRENGPAVIRVEGRPGGPAVIRVHTAQEWWIHGKLHREDSPALLQDNGRKAWYIQGKLHREDGPAMENPDGGKAWYINGQHHRTYGPAIEGSDGMKLWYLNGQRHREDGPAIIQANGNRVWYLSNIKVSGPLYKRLQRLGVSPLWHDWDEAFRDELVAAGVDPHRANEVYAAGVTEGVGLRKVLLEGVPLEWILAWEREWSQP